nr:reverse transcriptase domain, reverse transcriptase zinc-binding domain protein [Tanacetum cinerariifolium]GEX35663.1 reverse transcriptase domain, reverse transcriptase zinc-binding domain protein [Tanacetum cinerariifolium]
MSWSWRKLLKLRPLIRDFIWSSIGDDSKISLWFDRWYVASPLCNIISARDIARSGFSLTSKVCECIHGGIWSWPNDWMVKYPILSSIPVRVLNDAKPDVLEWRNNDGSFDTFSVQRVWETIRPRDNEVPWYDLVWFSSCIPRHAIHMWPIIKKRLKTQDALSSWDVVAGLTIWSHVKHNAGLSVSGSSLDSIVSILMPIAKRKSFKSCIRKLTLAAAAYFV